VGVIVNHKIQPGLKYAAKGVRHFLEDSFELEAVRPLIWKEQPIQKSVKKFKTINIVFIIISCFAAFLIYSVVKHYYDLNRNDNIIRRADKIALQLIIPPADELPLSSDADVSFVPFNSFVLSMLRDEFDNSDIVAYLSVPGASISYPAVMCGNNEFYLNHALDRSRNSLGSLFLDSGCDIAELSGRNYVIYGHSLLDLKHYLDRTYFNENKDIILILDGMITYWEVYAAYSAPEDFNFKYSRTSFASGAEFTDHLSHIQYMAAIKSNAYVTADDKILTLSAGRTGGEMLVVHAKLVEVINEVIKEVIN